MRNNKLTDRERIAAVQEYFNGKGSSSAIAQRYGITRQSPLAAKERYISQGEDAFRSLVKNTHYSPEHKRQAVKAYLSRKDS